MISRGTIVCMVVLLMFTGLVFGQGKTVSGQVISGEDRSPLLGVNIVVKGTERGTTTDVDGLYEIEKLSDDDVLVFFYVGFAEQEVTVGTRTEIPVRLSPVAISGDEEVVIGYGTVKRKDVTNAIATLDEHAFNKGVITDAQQLLQSRVPGVTVSTSSGDLGAAPLIRIRGGTSVTASNEPMIVIDGVPVENASATPSFETGEDNPGGGLQDNPLGSLDPMDIQSIDILKDASAAAIYGARGGNGVIQITTKSGGGGGARLNYSVYTSVSSQARFYDLLDASAYSSFAASVGATPEVGGTSTDWQEAVTRDAVAQNHHISFSSGTGNTNYLVSGSYLNEEGIVLGSDRERMSARLNIKHTAVNDRLHLGLRLNPSYTRRNNAPYRQTGGFRGGLFTNVLKYNPTLPVSNSDGSFFAFSNPDIRNPVAMAELIDDKSDLFRVLANATAAFDFMPNLTGEVRLGLDNSTGNRGIYQPNALPYAAAFGGRADVYNNDRQSVLLETTLNYTTDINENQNLQVWGGYSFQEFESSLFGAAAQGFVTDEFSFNNLAAGSDFSVRPVSFADKNRLVSFLGRGIYSINDKYILNGAVRYEGSSRFGSENKWGVFPSGSLGWRLSEESFLKDSGTFDDLKLRVSYGVTGNQDIGNYLSLLILGSGANAVIGDEVITGISPTQLANSDLRWEETTQVNLGLDFGVADNRISGSIDVYQKSTTDLLIQFTVPQPAVVETRLDNVGEVQNKGIEFNLNTINASSGDFFWRSNVNLALNRNEVVELGGREFIITGRVSGAGLSAVDAQIVMPGEPLGTFFGPRLEGYDANGNEIITTTGGPLGDGRFILGDAQPDYTFGISSYMFYKNFDLQFAIQGVQGFELLNNTRLEYQRPSNVFNSINLFAGAVDDVEDGLDPNATVAYSDKFIEDGSFIRLQNLSLGYTIDTDIFRNLRFYVSADNLLLITDYTGLDPEVNTIAGGDVPSLGIDYTNYPRARTFTLGMQVGLK